MSAASYVAVLSRLFSHDITHRQKAHDPERANNSRVPAIPGSSTHFVSRLHRWFALDAVGGDHLAVAGSSVRGAG
jgi:hypothetical protein